MNACEHIDRSKELFDEAVKYMPGGVNSPVRAFRSIGSTPRFIKRADGDCLWDEDGGRYIDYIGSWGPMILGHNHPAIRQSVTEACGRGLSFGAATKAEVEMAKLVCELVPSVEMVRMVNSGTEAVMSALRLARGARLYGQRENCEIYWLLSWAFGRTFGKGRFGRHDARCAGQRGSTRRMHAGYADSFL